MEYRVIHIPAADRKALSAAGHALAKNMIAAHFNVSADTLCFSKTESGKPYLPDSTLQFNISHSGTAVLCGIHNGDIGVDIEKTRPYNDRVAQRICSSAEYTYISGDDCRFLEVWTRKEAYAKLTGKGLSVSLRTIEVASETALHDTVCGCQVLTKAENGYVYSIIWELSRD